MQPARAWRGKSGPGLHGASLVSDAITITHFAAGRRLARSRCAPLRLPWQRQACTYGRSARCPLRLTSALHGAQFFPLTSAPVWDSSRTAHSLPARLAQMVAAAWPGLAQTTPSSGTRMAHGNPPSLAESNTLVECLESCQSEPHIVVQTGAPLPVNTSVHLTRVSVHQVCYTRCHQMSGRAFMKKHVTIVWLSLHRPRCACKSRPTMASGPCTRFVPPPLPSSLCSRLWGLCGCNLFYKICAEV
jgi:hypothetical protein